MCCPCWQKSFRPQMTPKQMPRRGWNRLSLQHLREQELKQYLRLKLVGTIAASPHLIVASSVRVVCIPPLQELSRRWLLSLKRAPSQDLQHDSSECCIAFRWGRRGKKQLTDIESVSDGSLLTQIFLRQPHSRGILMLLYQNQRQQHLNHADCHHLILMPFYICTMQC